MLGEKLPSSPIGLDLQNTLACLTSQTADFFFIILNKGLELQHKILLQFTLHQMIAQRWE